MGRRGPAPKPTALRRLEGNPGKRALNTREPQYVAKAPPCPRHLTTEARREWRRVARELLGQGLLQTVDRAALAAYCQAWARWVEAEQQMAAPGFQMVITTDKGYAHVSPWFQVATQSLKQMKTFLTEFGLTPASRSRIQTPERTEADEFEEFIARRRAPAPGQPAADGGGDGAAGMGADASGGEIR